MSVLDVLAGTSGGAQGVAKGMEFTETRNARRAQENDLRQSRADTNRVQQQEVDRKKAADAAKAAGDDAQRKIQEEIIDSMPDTLPDGSPNGLKTALRVQYGFKGNMGSTMIRDAGQTARTDLTNQNRLDVAGANNASREGIASDRLNFSFDKLNSDDAYRYDALGTRDATARRGQDLRSADSRFGVTTRSGDSRYGVDQRTATAGAAEAGRNSRTKTTEAGKDRRTRRSPFAVSFDQPQGAPPAAAPGGSVLDSLTPAAPPAVAPPAVAPPPAAAPAPAGIPPAVQQVLAGAGVGRHTLSDGSVWEKLPNGQIRRVQ